MEHENGMLPPILLNLKEAKWEGEVKLKNNEEPYQVMEWRKSRLSAKFITDKAIHVLYITYLFSAGTTS